MPQKKKTPTRDAGIPLKDRSFSRKGKTWFLGIGIDKYPPHCKSLNNAVKDVSDVKDLLLEKYELEKEQVSLLLDEQANRENIIERLDQLAEQLTKDDKLIIYYSGHGHLNPHTGLGYWIPQDAKKFKTAYYISNSDIRDYIKAIKTRHTLLISDSCFSGSIIVRGETRAAGAAIDDLDAKPSRLAFCSGRHDENVYDGEPGANSPFAESILEVLRNNRQKALCVSELAHWVREQTRSNYEQLPECCPLFGAGHKGGEFIFRLKWNEVDEWTACRAEDTLDAYQRFLAQYPEGEFAGEAKENVAFLKEEEAWAKAQTENTITSYFKYNKQYPGGRSARQAQDAIAILEEEQVWAKAVEQDTFAAFNQYRLQYPKGNYKEEADTWIQDFEHRQKELLEWQQTTDKDTISSYEAYLTQYLDGQFVSEARIRLNELRLEQAEQRKAEEKKEKRYWKKTLKKDVIAAFEDYLNKYPKGNFIERAKDRITELKAEENEWEKVKRKKSVKALNKFLATYPKSVYAEKAREKIEKIEDKRASTKVEKAEEHKVDKAEDPIGKKIARAMSGALFFTISGSIFNLFLHRVLDIWIIIGIISWGIAGGLGCLIGKSPLNSDSNKSNNYFFAFLFFTGPILSFFIKLMEEGFDFRLVDVLEGFPGFWHFLFALILGFGSVMSAAAGVESVVEELEDDKEYRIKGVLVPRVIWIPIQGIILVLITYLIILILIFAISLIVGIFIGEVNLFEIFVH